MIELKGQFAKAKIFTEDIDNASMDQIKELLNTNLAQDSKIRIMPDVHAGADNVIGLTMTIKDKLAPSLIGADIGCGIALYELRYEQPVSLKNLDNVIRNFIPFGYFKRVTPTHSIPDLTYTAELKADVDRNAISIAARTGYATLGGGNHFIEAYYKNENTIYLSVHTGSRTLGGMIYKFYQHQARNRSYDVFMQQRQSIIQRLKYEKRDHLISEELEKHKIEYQDRFNTDKSVKYIDGEVLENYLHDMNILNRYAYDNRRGIVEEIAQHSGAHMFIELVDKPHNYVETYEGVTYLRKGSQSAYPDEAVLIPINMRDGVILGNAEGNEDWNYSFPHGAGRVLSRSQAKAQIGLGEFYNSMRGVYTTSLGADTLDEAPMAYKTIESILQNVVPELKEGYQILKPIYNFKGGSERPTRKVYDEEEKQK